MSKRLWVVALFMTTALSLLLSAPIGHAQSTSTGVKSAGFRWDDNTLVFTGISPEPIKIAACSGIESRLRFDNVNQVQNSGNDLASPEPDFLDEIRQCLLEAESRTIPPGTTLKIDRLTNKHAANEYANHVPAQIDYVYSGSKALSNGNPLHFFCSIKAFTENNPNGSMDKVSRAGECWRVNLEETQSWRFIANGQDKDNRVTFINRQFENKLIRVFVKGNNIDKVDIDNTRDSRLSRYLGDIRDYTGSSIKGRTGVSMKHTAVEDGLNAQKSRLMLDYFDNCRSKWGSGRGSPCQREAFDVIWKACVVITGVGEGDIQAAGNCLFTYAGVTLDTKDVEDFVPPDVTEGSMYKCNIDKIGYVICPLMNFMAGAADGMFTAMKRMLRISPLDRNEPGGRGAYNAWSIFRNFANVILIIAILAIALSQISSYGISNYGAKKALPKLIVGGIILNSSFLISATLLDLSNILGESLHSVLLSINDSLPKDGDFITAQMDGANKSADSNAPLNWTFIVGVGLAGAGAVLAAIIMFVPILTAVIVALLIVIVLLLTRHVMIILLTVVAPVALILYVLPNTKQWFSKWRTHYFTLLMMFPAIAIIFGFSTVAANVILQIGTADESMTLRLFALAIQTAPLMVTPIIMRLGGQTLGSIGNSFKNSGAIRGVQTSAKNAQKLINNTYRVRALRGGMGPVGSLYRAKKVRDVARSKRKGELSQARARYVASYIQGRDGGEFTSPVEKLKEAATGGRYEAKTQAEKYKQSLGAGSPGTEGSELAAAYAKSVSLEEFEKDAKAQKLTMEHLRGGELHNELQRITNSDENIDDAYKQAVIEKAFERDANGGEDEDAIRLALEASGQVSQETRGYMLRAGQRSHLSAFMSNPETRQAVMTGNVDAGSFSKQVIAPTINSGALSPGDLQVMARVGGLDAVQKARTNNHLTHAGRESLSASVGEILNTNSLRGGLTSSQEAALRRLR